MSSLEARIRELTELSSPPLIPELRLHLCTPACELYRSTPEQAAALGVSDPYWAFAWGGGQALARFVLDEPSWVRDQRVLDFGSGSGLAGLAAAKAGAHSTLCADLDPYAAAAAQLNAAENALALEVHTGDLIGTPAAELGADVVLAAEATYAADLAERGLPWLRALARAGVVVLLSESNRGHVALGELELLATIDAPTDNTLSGGALRETGIYRVR